MIDVNPDSLYNIATGYWARLKEFIENHSAASDYILKRIQKEHEHGSKTTDFNDLYKTRFTSFVMAAYSLIEQKTNHAPSSRCFFVIPSEEQEKEDILKGISLEKRLGQIFDFIDDVPVKYINCFNDIVTQLKFPNNWKTDYYTLEEIARKYVGKIQDGSPFHLLKKVLEVHYRGYGNVHVRMIATKTLPDGQFEFLQNVFIDKDEAVDQQKEGNFISAKALDAFVESQKKEFDAKYGGKLDAQ